MDYVSLGKTGLKVSRLCLGMMSYGSKEEREWHLEENEALPFVKRALDAGINFFDTADVYSLGETEKISGNTLRSLGVRREDVINCPQVYRPNLLSRGLMCATDALTGSYNWFAVALRELCV